MVAPLIPVPPNHSLFLHVLIPKLVRQEWITCGDYFSRGRDPLHRHRPFSTKLRCIDKNVIRIVLLVNVSTDRA